MWTIDTNGLCEAGLKRVFGFIPKKLKITLREKEGAKYIRIRKDRWYAYRYTTSKSGTPRGILAGYRQGEMVNTIIEKSRDEGNMKKDVVIWVRGV